MKNLMKVVILSLGLLAFTGTADAGTIIIKTAPPKVKVEVRPNKPFKHAMWIPGHWQWKHHRYVWVKGHWVKARPGYAWVPGRYVKRHGGHIWINGRWKRM